MTENPDDKPSWFLSYDAISLFAYYGLDETTDALHALRKTFGFLTHTTS